MFKRSGVSVACFGGVLFAAGLAGAIFVGGAIIDIGALLLLCLGVSVARGNRSAAKWAIGFSGLYALAAVAVCVVSVIRPESVTVWCGSMTAANTLWALVAVGIVFVWSLANVVMLVKALREEGVEQTGQVEENV